MCIKAVLFSIVCVVPNLAYAQPDRTLFDGMEWREIGPFRGGRACAVSGVPGKPTDYYMGATGGGLWKTTDAGENWVNVSDGFFKTGSVGAIAVSQSNPEIVYVGMGETQIRGNISHGDGMYKSVDGGKTWSHIGLRDTRFIARARVHPENPEVVWVAALGHVYGPNDERGIFKSTDGGKSWRKVLFVNDRSGGVDISLDPNNPDVIFAATWEAWRTPYSLNSGGDGSRLFRSVDGGESWKDISRNPGLPTGTLGKIGVSVSAADSSRIYAIVEALDGGIFRSEDGGASWTPTNSDRNWRQRAWYYTRIYADPKDKDTVYVLNVSFGRSTNGGRTFTTVRVPHSDNHDLWINPDDPLDMVNSNDGGANVTKDGGGTWTEQDFATAQFYHVITDNAFPYRIYGAQQDNSTVRIWSRTSGRGIARSDWESTAGGESGYIAPKPDDPEIVFGGSYGGYLSRLNHRTGQSRHVNAWPDNPMGHGAIDLVHRFQWTFPIVFSPHDPNTLYTCSQFVLKTTNGGQTWKAISPDLTRNDANTMGPSGGPITRDNTSVEYYGTVFTLAESPLVPSQIWAGSDDGLVHLTLDGGASWTNVTPGGMPKWGLCSMIEASRHNQGTAYLAVDNHENDDYGPYVYITRDFGRTWTKAVDGIPNDTFVRVVREDPVDPNLLFAGTEMGVFISHDRGYKWQTLQLNLPIVPIHDLVIKEDDIVVATHGRSFWILDDITPLRYLSRVGNAPYLYPVRDAYRVRWGGNAPDGEPAGRNPLSGVVISFHLPSDAEVSLEVVDSVGEVVATQRVSGKKGFNRTSTFLQYPSYRPVQGMIFWAAGPRPIIAPPGEYTVRMDAAGATSADTFRWLRDPRSECTDEDLLAQYQFAIRIRDRVDEANGAVVKIREIKRQIADAGQKANLKADADALVYKFAEIEGEIYQVRNQSGQDPLNYPIKINNRIAALLGVVLSGDFAPTDQAYVVFARVSQELQLQLDALGRLVAVDLANFNAKLQRANVDPVRPPESQ